MKKSILVALLALMSCVSVYAIEIDEIDMRDTIRRDGFTKELYMRVIKEKWTKAWFFYSPRVRNENIETGEMTISLRGKEMPNLLEPLLPLNVSMGMLAAQMHIIIDFTCSDSACIVRVTQATCDFHPTNEDADAAATAYTLACIESGMEDLFKITQDELKVLIDYKKKYGTPFDCTDKRIAARASLLNNKLTKLGNAADRAKTKKEKAYAERMQERFLKTNRAELTICSTIHYSAPLIWAVMMYDEKKGLKHLVEAYEM